MSGDFREGDDIKFVAGQHEGHCGKVVRYEPLFDSYHISAPTVTTRGLLSASAEEIERLEDQPEPDETEESKQDTPFLSAPKFGLTREELAGHLDLFMDRALQKTLQVDSRDALFSFQEFEGMVPVEILTDLMDKLESGVVMLCHAHILLARTAAALQLMSETAEEPS